MEKKTILKIFRFDPDVDTKPRFDTYCVKIRPGMTVLEALFDILENQDASLSFRYACRGAVCGSCAMHINRKYRLACQTQIRDLRGLITVRPLGHFPIIKDLVVDMTAFFEKYNKIKPYLITPGILPEKEIIQTPNQRRRLDEMIDCILCACCYASCSMTLTDENYLGPAALMKANRFAADSRDRAGEERLKIVNNEDGLWRCHTIFNCVEVCPKKLNPTTFIASLKKKIIFGR